jgi:hypothetical protein
VRASATSAVITTGFPLASSLTSTGVAGGKSAYEIPASLIASALKASPGANAATRASPTAAFSSSVLGFSSTIGGSDALSVGVGVDSGEALEDGSGEGVGLG